MIDPIPSDPAPSQPVAVSTPSSSDASPAVTGYTATGVAALTSASQSTSAPSSPSSAQAQASGSSSGGASDAQSTAGVAQPLRLLIEHDKSTNQFVYKLYDSSGRIVREIPQESLAEAQKQASGALGSVIDTKV